MDAQVAVSPTNGASTPIVVLNQILELDQVQRQALAKAWGALEPGMFQPETIEQAHVSGLLESHDESEDFDFEVWLQETRRLPARERISILQSSLQEQDADWAADLLKAEIASVKDENPLLTVELAITNYAFAFPGRVAVIFVALGLLGYKVIRNLQAWIA